MAAPSRPAHLSASRLSTGLVWGPVLGGDRMGHDNRLVLTVAEAATALGISRAHAYELVARGDLPSLRLGRRIVVPRRGLERLLDGDADGTHAA
jgi:excisionase family DNA binding protein